VAPRRWRSWYTWCWSRKTGGFWEGDCEGLQKYSWEAAMPPGHTCSIQGEALCQAHALVHRHQVDVIPVLPYRQQAPRVKVFPQRVGMVGDVLQELQHGHGECPDRSLPQGEPLCQHLTYLVHQPLNLPFVLHPHNREGTLRPGLRWGPVRPYRLPGPAEQARLGQGQSCFLSPG